MATKNKNTNTNSTTLKTKNTLRKWISASQKYDESKREYLSNMYQSILVRSENTPKWRSKLFIGLTFGMVQNKVAGILPAFTDDRDFYVVKPTAAEINVKGKKINAEASARVMQLLMRQQEGPMKLYRTIYTTLLNTFIFGRSWSKITWERRKEKRQYFDLDKNEIVKIDKEIQINKPVLTPIADWDMIIPSDVYTDDIDDLEYLGNWQWVSIKDLKSNYYNNKADVNAYIRTLADNEEDLPDKVHIAIIHTNNHVYACDASGEYVFKDHITPYKHNRKPYVYMIDNPYGVNLSGESTVDQYSDIQKWTNKLVNGTIDEMNLSMHKIFISGPGMEFNKNQLRTRPGMLLRVNDPNNFKIVDPPSAKSDIYSHLAQLQSFTDKMLGNQDMIERKTQTTATEAKMSYAKAAGRNDLFIDYNKESFLKRLLVLWAENNQQFISLDNLKTFIPADLLKKAYMEEDNIDLTIPFIYQISGERGAESKQDTLNKINTALVSIAHIVQMPDNIKKDKLIEKVLHTLSLDPSEYLVYPEETAQKASQTAPPGTPQPGTKPNIQGITAEIAAAAKEQGLSPQDLVSKLSQRLGIPPEQLMGKIVQSGGLQQFLTTIKRGGTAQ